MKVLWISLGIVLLLALLLAAMIVLSGDAGFLFNGSLWRL